jgi:hypothetical protein
VLRQIVTVDLIDVITVIAGPTVARTTGIDVTIAATNATMSNAMTIVAMTTKTDAKIARMIAVTTIAGTTDVMTGIAKTTTTAKITTVKNGLHHHCLKGATITTRSRWPTKRLTSSSVVAMQPKATDKTDQTPGRSGKLALKTHSLCIGPNSQSLSPGKIIGFTSLTPGLTRWSSTP